MPRPAFAVGFALAGAAHVLAAQSTPAPAPPVPAVVRDAFALLERDNARTIDQQVALCEIPAPPFKEQARGVAFAKELAALGLTHIRTDGEGNVIGELFGGSPGPTTMLSAHLDTVFPEGTDVRVKREGTKLTAPGIGDDCRGLTVVLAVTRAMVQTKVKFPGRILVTGTVGEEGAGNLRGVRAIYASALKDSIDYFISVDGTGYGITNRGVGSIRYRVTFAGPGGHSYGAFGMPNPIHAMGRAIATVSDVQVPSEPRTTFNVGIVEGGRTVNTISDKAAMEVDMRSESWEALTALDAKVQAALRKALSDEKARWPNSIVPLTMTIDTIGIRAAGTTPESSPIVQAGVAAAKTVGVYAPLMASSTDSNVPISLGKAAITVDGGGLGKGAHSLDESYDDRTDGYKGPQFVLMLVHNLSRTKVPPKGLVP
ncbi:MAG: M20/M25/M40 family metallo-hydrolase [Gemmatimonadaceae bacterium]|jgi:acetylornithine deacetylase/succinyl-diaminopimelate desuccinylase-like protein|nr:M20/M25/M40 family metallo-hydrolase [Gemmatimonadaceae bacterium]